ncbi:hypothetical protein DPQ25_06685 [Hydrogeniiclostridium mannosilyticum]|uniref:DUF1848 domain-containing protein n=1 Tax=Hydrogeniiclostridium mannosilyticum TaxID=2764322 RepID=A0A328UFH3_9FIRM|nr:DUF1848 domain-containing protein [Hydrogeniiclostridium mannosilyticum]RAQ29170.1 hypothetical protein DPQ25_06685 [Hydrogeniiclostridium mannosilyticum]
MILSASRRTDIPALYADWFCNRLHAGYVYVRNPHAPHQISHIDLSPDTVDMIVFWTKNALLMEDPLEEITRLGYLFYFQYTITPYGSDIEPGLPSKQSIISNFIRLSSLYGKERMVWRYDPILVNRKYSMAFHKEAFANMCALLAPWACRCVFSFIDPYPKAMRRSGGQIDRLVSPQEMQLIAAEFSHIAATHRLPLMSCCEAVDLSPYGITHSACIDGSLIEKLLGCPLQVKSDPNQRAGCGCVQSIDIGAYDTCTHNCLYCYATHSPKTLVHNLYLHDGASPLLVGFPTPKDKIIKRVTKSLKNSQLSFDFLP